MVVFCYDVIVTVSVSAIKRWYSRSFEKITFVRLCFQQKQNPTAGSLFHNNFNISKHNWFTYFESFVRVEILFRCVKVANYNLASLKHPWKLTDISSEIIALWIVQKVTLNLLYKYERMKYFRWTLDSDCRELLEASNFVNVNCIS